MMHWIFNTIAGNVLTSAGIIVALMLFSVTATMLAEYYECRKDR